MRFQACVYTIISELPRYTSQGKGVVCALSVECVHVFVCVCFFWRARVCVCVSLSVCVCERERESVCVCVSEL